jgi:hypothetical protein
VGERSNGDMEGGTVKQLLLPLGRIGVRDMVLSKDQLQAIASAAAKLKALPRERQTNIKLFIAEHPLSMWTEVRAHARTRARARWSWRVFRLFPAHRAAPRFSLCMYVLCVAGTRFSPFSGGCAMHSHRAASPTRRAGRTPRSLSRHPPTAT